MDLAAIELMLATNHQPFSRSGWIFEFKYDGYRLLADKQQLLRRQKKEATRWFPEIVEGLAPERTHKLRYVDYLETEGERMFEFATSIGMEA